MGAPDEIRCRREDERYGYSHPGSGYGRPAVGILLAATIADLITLLTAPALLGQPTVVDRPIVDHTGLAGYFEMVGTMPLAPTPQGGGDIDTNGSFFTVMREQLGLKFSPAREMVDVLVIDSASLLTPISVSR